MKKMNFLKIACAAALSAACCFAAVGCSQTKSDSGDVSVGDTSEGVAATVNGTEIGEKAVTSYIANFRSMSNLESDADWAQWLVDNNYTAADIREEVINYYASQELIRQAAEENDIKVESSEIDSQVQQMRSYYDSDEDWENALKQIGTTSLSIARCSRFPCSSRLFRKRLPSRKIPPMKSFCSTPRCMPLTTTAQRNRATSCSIPMTKLPPRKCSTRLTPASSTSLRTAKEYSQDEGSKEDGGNVGWDKLTSFVDEYQTALDGLEEGQVSGLVTSSYGIHIIKCTQVFNAPEEVTSIDQLPSEFMDSIKSTLEASAKQQAYSQWYQDYKSNADIQINDMPSGLVYDVSLDGVEPSSTSASKESDASTSADSSTESSAENASTESSQPAEAKTN